jgi:cytochrome c556
MKIHLAFFALVLTLLFAFKATDISAREFIAKEPPESLKKYYPPNSSNQEFSKKMIELNDYITALTTYFKADDFKKIDKYAPLFLNAYTEASKMVPEWKEIFHIEKVEKFLEVVKGKNKENMEASYKELGVVCDKCHLENRISVWTKFYWPPFKELVVTDPESESEFKYEAFMKSIAADFSLVKVYFSEGEKIKAKKAVASLEHKYMELKSTCSKCHTNDIVKQVFFGENIVNAFKELKKNISTDSSKSEEITKILTIINKEGCKMCHLTHLSYSAIKEIWLGH